MQASCRFSASSRIFTQLFLRANVSIEMFHHRLRRTMREASFHAKEFVAMKRIGSLSFFILIVLCFLTATERRAYGFSGYIDPGSGLLALQCITSAVVATGYFLRRQIRSLFGRKEDLAAKAPHDAS
jgi:hypothetical protein